MPTDLQLQELSFAVAVMLAHRDLGRVYRATKEDGKPAASASIIPTFPSFSELALTGPLAAVGISGGGLRTGRTWAFFPMTSKSAQCARR